MTSFGNELFDDIEWDRTTERGEAKGAIDIGVKYLHEDVDRSCLGQLKEHAVTIDIAASNGAELPVGVFN